MAQEALCQIEEKQYDAPMTSAGLSPDKVRRLAVILQGKRVIVRE